MPTVRILAFPEEAMEEIAMHDAVLSATIQADLDANMRLVKAHMISSILTGGGFVNQPDYAAWKAKAHKWRGRDVYGSLRALYHTGDMLKDVQGAEPRLETFETVDGRMTSIALDIPTDYLDSLVERGFDFPGQAVEEQMPFLMADLDKSLRGVFT